MNDNNDITVAARNFLKRFGDKAPAEAQRRARELQEAGKGSGYVTWMLIYDEVRVLLKDGADETNP
ncbi:MAG: hypothetical protein IIC55_07535 [Proteobacteria bacterium]|nr:hypothetical protein [Pseudomonadota bacterium]